MILLLVTTHALASNDATIGGVSWAIWLGRPALVTFDAADMTVFDHIRCRAIKAGAIPHSGP